MVSLHKVSVTISLILLFPFNFALNINAELVAAERVSWVSLDGADVNTSLLVPGGRIPDSDYNATLYVARGKHKSTFIPGVYNDFTKTTRISHHQVDIAPTEIQFLVAPAGSISWVQSCRNCNVPGNLIHGGVDPDTIRSLFVCRAWEGASLITGKFIESPGVCSIPHGGSEFNHTTFEILTLNGYGQAIDAGNGIDACSSCTK